MAKVKIILDKKKKEVAWEKGDYGQVGDNVLGDNVFILSRDSEKGEWFVVYLDNGHNRWGIPKKAIKLSSVTLQIKVN